MRRFIRSLTEGSLLQRTLLCISTLVLGSLTFVAVTSFVLVSLAKEVFPSRTDEPTLDKGDDVATETGSPQLKPPRSTRTKPSLSLKPPVESDEE